MKGLADQWRLGAWSKLLSTQSEGAAQRSTYFRCSTNSGSCPNAISRWMGLGGMESFRCRIKIHEKQDGSGYCGAAEPCTVSGRKWMG